MLAELPIWYVPKTWSHTSTYLRPSVPSLPSLWEQKQLLPSPDNPKPTGFVVSRQLALRDGLDETQGQQTPTSGEQVWASPASGR